MLNETSTHEASRWPAAVDARLAGEPSRWGSCLFRANSVAQIIDAIYAETLDFDEWRRGLVDVAARLSGFDVPLHVEVARRTSPHVVEPGSSTEFATRVVLGDDARRLTSYDRAALARLELYLDNAARFRSVSAVVRGVVSLEDETTACAGHGRSKQEIWKMLVRGDATVVPTSRRATHYVLMEAPESSRQRRALTDLELRAVTLAATGISSKALSAALELSSPSVCRLLANAAAKVGTRGPFDLVRLAARLASAPPAIPSQVLTVAEREVLRLVRRGLSNDAIALTRQRSLRTVANQVAAILRKTGSSSRRALMTGAEVHAC